jgi:hypothetical protein
MKVIYEKTYFEQLVDNLEQAHISGRQIKHIEVSVFEYKKILEMYLNTQFLQSVKSKVIIKQIDSQFNSNDLTKVNITYQVVDNWNDMRCANLKFVQLIIL